MNHFIVKLIDTIYACSAQKPLACDYQMNLFLVQSSGIILGMGSANERWRYIVW